MTNQDIIFSALMGSGSFKTVQRLEVVQNELSKHVLPGIPFMFSTNENGVKEKPFNKLFSNNQQQDHIPEAQQFFPLSFSFTESGEKWVFPFEPMISISGGNEITKVNVSRHGVDKKGNPLSGSIKARTRTKDFEITITGVLIGSNQKGKPEDCFPYKQFQKLFKYLIHIKELFVYCYPLELLGINRLVIESYSFPFTKGENVQAYEIKALSDYPHSLIVPFEKPKIVFDPNEPFVIK